MMLWKMRNISFLTERQRKNLRYNIIDIAFDKEISVNLLDLIEPLLLIL